MKMSIVGAFGVMTARVPPMGPQRPVGWSDVWSVVKASALHRLGKPLLVAYALLAVFGLVVVAVSLLVMRFG